ncbi:MAG TPA: hypothetical protein PLF61_01570, partial [Candidatus Goldiibacteriota bacterium]|nr:hypothetical protein [Candidatus Goldiibacteriota bacterium]
YFVKKFPETSFRLSYFVPTFFLLYLVSFILPVFFLKKMMVLWTLPLIVYLLLLFIDGIKLKRPKTVVLTMAGIFITHVAYGIYFVFGLLSKKLTEENNGSIK